MKLAAQFCTTFSGEAILDVNNVRAKVQSNGYLFNKDDWGGFEVPKDGNVSAIYAGGLWLAAIDENGQQKTSALMYKGIYDGDFIPGPLDENGETVDDYCQEFDRLWSVYGADIEVFIEFFEDCKTNGISQLPKEDIPASILNWPGRNNPHFTDFTLPKNKDLAPFWDQNGDGIYDPTKGDYPVINERNQSYADQMIWSIFNDKGEHKTWEGVSLGMEIGMLVYAFNDYKQALKNTVFVDYRLHYLGKEKLNEVYFGQFVDVEIGYYRDDFLGCIPEKNLAFAYNGTANDEQYGKESPIMGMRILKGLGRYLGNADNSAWVEDIGMSSLVYQKKNSFFAGPPRNPDHIANYLKGKWRTGEAMIKDDYGYDYDDRDLEETKFVFAANPSDPLPAWSECTTDSEPGDRRFLAASGPSFFYPNNVQHVRLAFNATFDDSEVVCVDVSPLIQNMEVIRLYSEEYIGHFADDFTIPLTATTLEPAITANTNLMEIAAYPNPANAFVDFTCENLPLKEGVYWSLYNAQGNQITQRLLNTNHFRLNRETMVAGMYFYQLKTKAGDILGNGKLIFE